MRAVSLVPGLYIQENVMDENTEQAIINWLDQRQWSTVLPRRTQHFGYNYGYKSHGLTKADPFDSWVSILGTWLDQNNILKSADQCIVNEYTKDQKIGKHVDRSDIFGDKIVSISLGGDTNFIFRNLSTKESVELFIPRRSILIMTGDSRYNWSHEIPKRLTVNHDGHQIRKNDDYRRISMTYRKTK